MRFVLLILLFMIFVIIAILVYFVYYFKYILYKDMVYICRFFKNNIAFNKNKVAELFNKINHNISFFTKSVIYKKTNNISILLKKSDMLIVDDFVASLGKGDVDYEISNLNYYENLFEENRTMAKELLQKDAVMYLKLIIGMGLAFCIILI